MLFFFRVANRHRVVAVALAVAVAAVEARQAAPTREPASKAAAILTWPPELREQYIAALDAFFLTRTVKAGPRPRVLERGRSLGAFESGGVRADDLGRFMNDQRVRGVLVKAEVDGEKRQAAPGSGAVVRDF